MHNVFRKTIAASLPEITVLRHELHAHPELHFEERWTSDRIAAFLSVNRIPHTRGHAGGTGICGVIEGCAPGKTALLRADMDALPITEATGLPYASRIPGCMHACGHDGHMAILCAAAKALIAHRDRWRGTIRLIFQPGEEQTAGGRQIVQEGLLEGVDAAFALHGWPVLPLGQAGLRAGCAMASADFFRVDIEGRGGHGADPGATVDPIVVAAQTVLALQTIASREIDPWEPVVISVGRVESGSSANVIPAHARMEGTFRALRPETRERVRQAIIRIAEHTAQTFRATAQVTFDETDNYPPLITDPTMTALAREVAIDILGRENTIELPHPYMVAEDFAYYLEKAPGTFLFLGLGQGKLHTPDFDFNDAALLCGALLLSTLAERFLNAG